MSRPTTWLGQTVVVIGGSAGIGLETARRARAEGADVILTGRNPDRLREAAAERRCAAAPRPSTPPTRPRSKEFFDGLDRRSTTCWSRRAGRYYVAAARDGLRPGAPRARRAPRGGAATSPATPPARCGPAARCCSWAAPAAGDRRRPRADRRRPPRRCRRSPRTSRSSSRRSGSTSSPPGFVDTPLSASLLGDQLDARRDELRATLPIGRVVGPADVAALAVHLMTNTALTGATYDIDGGQQLVRLTRPRDR